MVVSTGRENINQLGHTWLLLWLLLFVETVHLSFHQSVRNYIQEEAFSKSWHCQNWFEPPSPNFGTLVDLLSLQACFPLAPSLKLKGILHIEIFFKRDHNLSARPLDMRWPREQYIILCKFKLPGLPCCCAS